MCSISLDNESCEILLGVEADVPEENLLRECRFNFIVRLIQ